MLSSTVAMLASSRMAMVVALCFPFLLFPRACSVLPHATQLLCSAFVGHRFPALLSASTAGIGSPRARRRWQARVRAGLLRFSFSFRLLQPSSFSLLWLLCGLATVRSFHSFFLLASLPYGAHTVAPSGRLRTTSLGDERVHGIIGHGIGVFLCSTAAAAAGRWAAETSRAVRASIRFLGFASLLLLRRPARAGLSASRSRWRPHSALCGKPASHRSSLGPNCCLLRRETRGHAEIYGREEGGKRGRAAEDAGLYGLCTGHRDAVVEGGWRAAGWY